MLLGNGTGYNGAKIQAKTLKKNIRALCNAITPLG
jgi:hypothetical protein